MIKTDLSGIAPFVKKDEFDSGIKTALKALEALKSGSCRGAGMLGWLNLPERQDRDLLKDIRDTAQRIKKQSAALVVIGIGGSYLGARAGLELIKGENYNVLPKSTPDIYFTGNNISGRHMKNVIRLIGDRDFSVIVISKSGTTTEPAIAFRVFRGILEEKYGKAGATERIIAITDDSSGALRKMAEKEGWQTFAIPDSVGGRYSVLTPVGLLPLACAGVDPYKINVGAYAEMIAQMSQGAEASAVRYAAARHVLYSRGYSTEILSTWESEAVMFAEWWKQLFGESEGKELGGVFPAAINCTTDLHSMGQYVQQGRRNIMETFLTFDPQTTNGFRVPAHEDDADGLGYLAGRALVEINEIAAQATKKAHIAGGVPCMDLRCSAVSDESFGSLCYFFELACAISGVMLGINPFDQPGVEDYKRNMFALLGRPGYEQLRENLLKSSE